MLPFTHLAYCHLPHVRHLVSTFCVFGIEGFPGGEPKKLIRALGGKAPRGEIDDDVATDFSEKPLKRFQA